MSQPVKVSDTLALDARLTGEAADRSIAGQIRLGWEAHIGSFRQPPVPSRQEGKTVKPGRSAAEGAGANSWTEYLDRRRIVANDKGNTRDGVLS
jgi:hypothetical protein